MFKLVLSSVILLAQIPGVEWPTWLQLILQCGSLGILGIFLLWVMPMMNEKAVDKISSAQTQSAELFFRAMQEERRTYNERHNDLVAALKDHAGAVREQGQRLDRLAFQAVCRFPQENRRNKPSAPRVPGEDS